MCIRDRARIIVEEKKEPPIEKTFKDIFSQEKPISETVSYTHLDVYKRQDLDIGRGHCDSHSCKR